MKLNPKANQIRNLNLSDNKETTKEERKEDVEMKQEMLDVLKKKTDYKKDTEKSKSKRERRAKIRELAWNDTKKMVSFKETFYTEEEKKESDLCPFTNHKGYADLWKKLNPEWQKQMKENFRISADGKIESIKMKKKFSMLTAQHNGKDIFDGSHEDQYGKKWIKWVTYLTGKAAEKACKEQNKKLLNDRTEVEEFINYFPWETIKEKIFNFVNMFGLEKAGYWRPNIKEWSHVGSVGYAGLSRVDGNDTVYGVTWNNGSANIDRNSQRFPSPFVACEDC